MSISRQVKGIEVDVPFPDRYPLLFLPAREVAGLGEHVRPQSMCQITFTGVKRLVVWHYGAPADRTVLHIQ